MIRIREQDGTVHEVAQGQFVEFTDEDGAVAQVMFLGPTGELRTISASTPEAAERYEKFYGVNIIRLKYDLK